MFKHNLALSKNADFLRVNTYCNCKIQFQKDTSKNKCSFHISFTFKALFDMKSLKIYAQRALNLSERAHFWKYLRLYVLSILTSFRTEVVCNILYQSKLKFRKWVILPQILHVVCQFLGNWVREFYFLGKYVVWALWSARFLPAGTFGVILQYSFLVVCRLTGFENDEFILEVKINIGAFWPAR